MSRLLRIPGFMAGGVGEFTVPDDHVAAMQVPKGGSCCANCHFVDAARHECRSPSYSIWNGGSPKLPPLPLDEICSDWYEPAAGTLVLRHAPFGLSMRGVAIGLAGILGGGLAGFLLGRRR